MKRYNHASLCAAPSDAPISALNTTPLIDVMLVLLIMFIVTIPIAAHKVPLDLPGGPAELRTEPVTHRLEIDAAGRITLDGRSVSQAELATPLAAIAADPMRELSLRAEAETPYDRFDHVLAAVKRAGVTRMGMVGNERFVEAVR